MVIVARSLSWPDFLCFVVALLFSKKQEGETSACPSTCRKEIITSQVCPAEICGAKRNYVIVTPLELVFPVSSSPL